MDDTISRQAAIDSLEEQLDYLQMLNKDDNPTAESKWYGVNWARDTIADLPSAQPEIVRCKDCKHQIKEWRDDKRLKDKGYWVYGCKVMSDLCGYWNWFGQDDEFCSDAERRTDG